jgi:hypothetical protein
MKFYSLPFFLNSTMPCVLKFRIHRDEEFNEIEFQPLTGKKTFFSVMVVDEEFSQEFQFRFFDGGIPAKHF